MVTTCGKCDGSIVGAGISLVSVIFFSLWILNLFVVEGAVVA
jgi:hypothetical protein